MKLFGTVLPYIGFRTRFFPDYKSLPAFLQEFVGKLVQTLPDQYLIEDIDLVTVEVFSLGWFGWYVNFPIAVTPYFNWEK